MWITNGPDADTLVVYAKTDPEAGRARHHRLHRREGHEGLLDRAEARQARHARLATPCELVFEDCEVPAENVLGAGERRRQRADERPRLRARGARRRPARHHAGACMDVVLPYVHERKQFGQPIGEFQLMQGKLADMYTDAATPARAYVYAVAQACDRGASTQRARTRPARSCTPPRRRPGWRGEAIQASAATATSTSIPTGRLLARRQALRDRRRHQRDPPHADRPRAVRRDTLAWVVLTSCTATRPSGLFQAQCRLRE